MEMNLRKLLGILPLPNISTHYLLLDQAVYVMELNKCIFLYVNLLVLDAGPVENHLRLNTKWTSVKQKHHQKDLHLPETAQECDAVVCKVDWRAQSI